MVISKETLYPYLLYNKPIPYDENIILYPITMEHYILFNALVESLTIRKNSIFRSKKIVKMSYLDFLIFSFSNEELENEYNIPNLSKYYIYAVQLLQMCCKNSDVKINQGSLDIYINSEKITPKIFDDIRKIIFIQNDVDYDDKFLNRETEELLNRAQEKMNRNVDKAEIEDYIDSLIVALNIDENRVMNMTIRKFWRYVNRLQLHENYTICKTGECSGLVKFKEPIRYWMLSIEKSDKYSNLKASEDSVRSKIG